MILTETFPAFKHRNFRYFWFGQCISLMGTWIQNTAQQWLVYTITKSAFLLGLLGAAQFAPILLFSLFVGVLIDKYPKKHIIIVTQTVLMLQAFALALLVWNGNVRYWQILCLAVILGTASAVDMPSRQSWIIDLTGKAELRSAIALNSAIFNLARLVSPAVAVMLMVKFGAAFAFFLNGLSFLAVLTGLFMIKVPKAAGEKKGQKVFADIASGIKYIGSNSMLISAICSVAIIGLLIMNFNVVVPPLADKLGYGARGFGFLLSAMGTGSFLGALLIASRAKKNPSRKLLFGSAVTVAVTMIATAFVKVYALALVMLALLGFINIVFVTTANSMLQLNSSDEFRGRTTSVYNLFFAGTTPFGNLLSGSITQRFGPSIGFFVCGFAALLLLSGLILRVQYKQRCNHRLAKL